MIRMIVGRLHVATPDPDVVAYVVSRLKAGAWEAMTATERGDIAHAALDAHREHMDLYRSVMG